MRTGTFFTVIFAACFECARRWNFARPLFLAGALVILAGSAVLIRLRKLSVDVLADLGAGALLFAVLWSAGMSSDIMSSGQRTLNNKDFIMNAPEGWAEVYTLNGETFVTLQPVLFSEFADGTVEALEYGINSQPDKIIQRENFMEHYEKITSSKSNDIQYVTSRLIFTDKTRSDVSTAVPLTGGKSPQ